MHRRHAFTLLEMSIVIVIIGLLTGGLVAGRNYIKNAEMTGLVNEGKFYINVFNQFQEKYGTVPGDLFTASSNWPGAHDGDGNGRIEPFFDSGGAWNGTMEFLYTFEHLNRAKLIDGSYTGDTAGPGFTINTNLPRGIFPSSTWLFDHPSTGGGYDGDVASHAIYFDGLYRHVLIATKMTAPSANPPLNSLLAPKQVLSLDTKFDDGRPGMGWMTVSKIDAGTGTGCADATDQTSAAYNTAIDDIACVLIFKVD